MMKKYRFFTAIGLVAALLFTACSQDEWTDDNALPEGKYPLQIASVTMEGESSAQPWGAKEAQTRVSEKDDGTGSVWETGDELYVKFQGSDQVGKYRIKDAATGAVEAVTPVYWQSASQEQTIIAWYAPDADADGKLDLSEQSERIIYAIRAEETTNYQREVLLHFRHQLAKVRVILSGNTSEVTSVQIESLTTCTHSQGTVSGTNPGAINMRRVDATTYEANVVPDYEIVHIKVNDNTNWSTLSTPVTPEKGKYHRINVSVATTIDLSEGTSTTDAIELNEGAYVIKGTGSEIARPIVVNGDADITFENAVQIKVNGDENNGAVAMKIADGKQVKLTVKGTGHSLVSTSTDGDYGCGIEIGDGASIEIVGEGSDKSSLTVQAGCRNSAIGLRSFTTAHCSGITIKDIALTVVANDVRNAYLNYGAAIGLGNTGSGYKQSCDFIRINNASITATAIGSGVCIGTGSCNDGNKSIKEIQISNSTLSLTVARLTEGVNGGYQQGACIGFGAPVNDKRETDSQTIGSITITDTEFVNCSGAQIVGSGSADQNAWNFQFTATVTNGISVNGTNCKTYWNSASAHD